jgi:hypothetical protein
LVKALPDSNLIVSIKEVCAGQPVVVELSGLGALTAITLIILYLCNNIGVQMVPLMVNAGRTSYTSSQFIPNSGFHHLTNKFSDSSTGCSASMNTNTKNIVINALPNVPLTSNQEFCKVQNATIANLVPNGSQYRWYNSITSTTALPASTVLQSGNYYVKEVNATTGCESGLALAQVVINEL